MSTNPYKVIIEPLEDQYILLDATLRAREGVPGNDATDMAERKGRLNGLRDQIESAYKAVDYPEELRRVDVSSDVPRI